MSQQWIGGAAVLLGGLLTSDLGGAESDAQRLKPALVTIRDADVRSHVDFLTSDRCAGRDTPQPGLMLACDYVAERFKEFGLEPLGAQEGSFRRNYGLDVIDVGEGTSLVVAGNNLDELECKVREDFVPVSFSKSDVAEGELAFVGYGITERKYRWDSYKKINVKGKIVVVLTREPRADDKNKKFFEGREATEPSSLRVKAKTAADAGAVGMLVCAPDLQEQEVWMNSQLPRYQGGGRRGGGRDLALPAAIISTELAEQLLGRSPDQLRSAIDGKRRPETFAVDGVRVRLEVQLTPTGFPVPNIVARYPGRDADLLDSVVVVGAHLDHIGVDDRGRIYRGADDNAGGVAGLIEVAEAFAKSQVVTRRSVVFIAFTGEEKGLLGSKAYVKEPAVKMENTYAMINMDIIARGRAKAIEATPPPKGSFLDKLVPKAVKLSGCRLKVGNGGKEFFQRSDQFAFHEAGVPTVFFNEGETDPEVYHLWTDTPDGALEGKIARVAKLAFTLTWLSANSDQRGGLK